MKTVQKRYWQVKTKAEKSVILDEICENLEIERKSAIRAVNRPVKTRKRPKKATNLIYSKKVIWLCEILWELNDYPCGTILKTQIPLFLKDLKKEQHIDEITEKHLLQISSSTIDRRLLAKKRKLKNKLYGKTKPGLLLKAQIPIRTNFKGIKEPGHIETDTVSHSGPHAAGEFIYTVNAVDILTSWVMRQAVLGKGEIGVQKAIDSMRQKAPFSFLDIDFDNGSEFLNYHFIRYCQKHAIGYTRSRPEEKNDQAHIEQKNRTHVRNIFGRQRFDKLKVLHLMNRLYTNELDLYHNFFRPCVKLKKKEFVGSKVKRKYTEPMTPYQRIQESTHIKKEVKEQLKKTFESINPIALKRTIDQKIKQIKKLQKQLEES